MKLTEAADLEKAGTSLAGYFAKRLDEITKTHAHHAALAAHSDAMAGAHKEYAAHHKATHDGLANDHELKGHFAKGHTHHTQMAAHHEAIAKAHGAHAETLKAEIDTLKTLTAEWGGTAKAATPGTAAIELVKTTGSLEERVKAMSDMLLSKALESINNSPVIAQKLEEIVLSGIEKTVGNKLVPTEVRAVVSDNPAGLKMIPRAGSPAAAPVAGVPLEFEKLFKADDESMSA